MASKTKSRKKEKTARWFSRPDILAATLYWLVRLVFLVIDRFIG